MVEKNKRSQIKKKKIFYNTLMGICLAILVFSVYKIISYVVARDKSDDIYGEVESQVVSYESSSGEESKDDDGYYHAPIPTSIDFKSLLKKNKDVVGWIFNENGVINYPIMQSNDNDYYLNRLIDGSANANGSIFMDYKNKSDFTDYNTLIYGHSMKNGTMFASLLRYRNQEYYSEYPSFYIYTPEKKYRVDVFAAYVAGANDRVYDKINTQAELDSFVAYAFSKSKIKTSIPVGAGDKIVSFSTCEYSTEDGRFLVCGKLEEIN